MELTVALCVAITLCASALGQVQFVEVAAERGLQPYQMAAGMGGGAAAADFDNDGDIDIFVPNGYGYADQLYQNDGTGRYVEIAAAAGVGSTARNRSALWLDYDGDGDLDLLVAGDCWRTTCTEQTTLRLYRQYAEGRFEDVTKEAGLFRDLARVASHLGGMCAGDVNNDGFLDICLALWDGKTWLFLNDGRGAFTDISVSSGVGAEQRQHWQPVMHDFDRDGWLDIFVAVDFSENRLWINQRDGTFIDAAPQAGAANAFNDMGVAICDYDNDGDFDLYVTNIAADGMHNILLRNDTVDGALSFSEISHEAGVDNGYWGWGAAFMDCDNDGLVDLATTNGWRIPPWNADPSRFFLNLGGQSVTFAEVSDQVGFNDTEWGSALISFDSDRDGNLDLLQVTRSGAGVLLLENRPDPDSNAYLVVKPRMLGPNSHAIGAVVRVSVAETTMARLITAGVSFIGQAPAEAHFGVGTASTIDSVVIDWPNGDQTVLYDTATDVVLTVTYHLPGDPNCDDRIDAFDIEPFLVALFDPDEYESRFPDCDISRADVNIDGEIDEFDIEPFLDLLFGT